MSHGYTYNQDEWDAAVQETAVPAKGKRNRRKEFLWAFRGALIVSLAAVCIWFFAYGGNNSVAGIYSSGSASTTETVEEILSSEETSAVVSSEESSEEEEVSPVDRCDPEYWPGGFRNPDIMYCDGDWMRVGEKQTDHLVVYQWVSGAWQEYEPHGKTATSFDCYDSSQMESDGVSSDLREELTACDSGENESYASAAGGKKCGMEAQEAAYYGAAQLSPWRDHSWAPKYAGTKDYDPCSALSYIYITIEGATISSPSHLMLFHYGEYLGTATYEPYPLISRITRDSDSAITVNYKYARGYESGLQASGRTTAHFRWDDGQQKVVMTGEAPPCMGNCD